MKNLFYASLIILSIAVRSHATAVGFAYENEAALKEGRALLCPVTPEGLLVPAKFALTYNETMLMARPQEKLQKAILLRLDNKANAAIIQPGEVIQKEDLQKIFAERAAALTDFLPGATAAPVSDGSMVVQFNTTEPFILKINNEEPSAQPIQLIAKNEQSEIMLEVIRASSSTVWFVDIELTAEPKLSFWRKNKEKKMLSDIPRPKFKFSYQGMFTPLSQGKSFKLPIEIHFIKEEAYTLTFKIKSKSGAIEKKVPVVFKTEK